jgi:hypothetical protein
VFVGILDELSHRCSAASIAHEIVHEQKSYVFSDEYEHTAVCYYVLQCCVSVDDESDMPEVGIGRVYAMKSNHNENLEFFKEYFLTPIIEYLDEQLNDQRAVLSLLLRYKQKCEWFERNHLLEAATRGERELASHLYAYLHDQGLDFVIEPVSASGEVDFLANQSSDDPLVADAKVFRERDSKSDISKWFNQIYTYTRDYNEPSGYLVIFNTSGRDLKLSVQHSNRSTPFVIHNSKVIFFVVIDIHSYDESASKRGRLTVVEVTETDLTSSVHEE